MADLYVLTNAGCYLLFPPDTSPERPFYFTGPTGAFTAWSSYPSQFYIDLQTQVFFGGKANWVLTDGAPPSPLCGLGPSPGINFPHLEKPAWLMTFLASCNWQIFTWYVNPGDWIESAIDWVLDGINDLLDLGESIANKAVQAWETLKTIWGDITDEIGRRVAPIWNEITDFADKLTTVWNNVTDWVGSKWQDFSDWVGQRLADIEPWLQKVENEWNDFWRNDFPNLIDKITFWDNFNEGVKPINEEVSKQGNWIDSVKLFFDNPIMWLWDEFNAWFWKEE